MKKIILSFVIALTAFANGYSQCGPFEPTVSPVLCSDPANGIYIVDPTADVHITIEDLTGTKQSVAWTPADNLFMGPSPSPNNPGFPLPANGAFPVTDVYFNILDRQDVHDEDGDGNQMEILPGDAPYQTYTYTGKYTASGAGCTEQTAVITIVTGGFVFDDYCFGSTQTLADIDLLSIPDGDLTWYDDQAGTILLPNTTTLEGDKTYYVNLGPDFSGCSQVFPVEVKYSTPVPQGEGVPRFCSALTWQSLGVSGKSDPTLGDLGFCGQPGATLTFYDAAGNVIPNSTLLQDGVTYYVTQTVGGCESAQMAIVPDEQFCACSENAGMEDINNLTNSFQVHYQDDPGPISPGVCNVNPSSINQSTPFGALNSAGDDPAVPVSSGWDPAMLVEGNDPVYFPTTSPLKSCSKYAIRMNSPNDASYGSGGTDKAVKVTYDFIAGEVFTFDFAAILRAAGHSNSDQPYFKVLIMQGGSVIQERCIIANEDGCTFYNLPGAYEPILYSEWSCVKLSTQDILGQSAQAIFIVSDCAQSGDFGYAYIDNIYVGSNAGADCAGTFGYVYIDSNIPDGDAYEACSEVEVPVDPDCEPALEALNPTFPIAVTGTYKAPESTGNAVNLITTRLSVYQNSQATPVLVKTGGLNLPPPNFQFNILQSEITDPYGYFRVEVEMEYNLGCGQNGQSSSIQTFKTDSKGFKFCPTAGCLSGFSECTGTTGPETFDLRLKEPELLVGIPAAQHGDYKISYYTSLADAENGANAIPNPSGYQTSNSIVIYVRLEYDFNALGITPPVNDCFDIVTLDINIGTEPIVPLPIADATACSSSQNADFNLTQLDASIKANEPNPGDWVVSYYTNQANANAGTPSTIPDVTNYAGTDGDILYVRVEKVVDGCYIVAPFTLATQQIAYNTPLPLTLCDMDSDPTDLKTNFDLTNATTQIAGGSTTLTMTYYADQTDAQNGTPGTDLGSNYTNTTAGTQTIYVVIEDSNNPNCRVVEPLDLNVLPLPDAFPANAELCDDDLDGTGTFTLDPALNGTVDGGAGMTVTYHATQLQADNNTSPITTYTATTMGANTVYARVDNGTCYSTSEVTLTLKPAPEFPTPLPTLENCDDGDGTVAFDLTLNEGIIKTNEPNPGDWTVTYYANQTNLNSGTAIPTADLTGYDNTAQTQTIFVKAVSVNGCEATTSFDIIVNPLPTFNSITSLVTCDQLSDTQDGLAEFDLTNAETQISNGTGTTITFYDSQPKADAGVAGTEISTAAPYPNTTVGQTIFVRIEDSVTGCFVTTSFTLDAIPAPTVVAPSAYEMCDGDDGNIDGNATFNLPSLDGPVSDNATGVTVTYHPDQAAADAGTPTVTSPASYSAATGSVFARVQETSGAGCYNTVEVILTVLESPLLPATVTPLEACDPEGDNIESFILTDAEVDIRINEATSAAAPWTVTYYASAADRSAGTTVPDETDFTNDAVTPTQTVYYQVMASNGCVTNGQFDIVVNSLPGVNTPEPRIICGDGSGNGTAIFDLKNATTQITGNNPNFTVTYYDSEAKADAAVAGTEIQTPGSYTNDTPDFDSVWIRIVDNNTGCTVVLEVPLEVKEAPTATVPVPYEVCDPDNDGKHVFDLPTLDSEITGDVLGVTVTYHETQANAENDVLDITNPTAFANTVNDTQTIYARVESAGVDCYVVVNVVLVVNPSPQPVLPEDLPALMGCDENGDGQYQFDLTEMADDIKANEANPADFTLEYYADPTDIPANPIGTPSGYLSGSGTIYVVVTGANDCTKQTSFELIVNPLPVITTPQPLELCDVNNPGDEKEEFDLTQATMDITMGDASITISYWKSQGAADTGDTNSPDYIGTPTAYTNQVNNETIYIRAEDMDTGCTVTQGYTLTLIVNPLPSPEIPSEPLEVCDADNDGFVEFDLDDIIPAIQNGEPDVDISFHYSAQDAENGVGAIDTTLPFQLTSSNNQTLYVRAENTLTGCYVTGPLELVVVPTPEIVNLEDLYVCDDDTPNGFAVFDLTENNPNILGSQDPTDLEITYHTSQQDAADGVNSIDVPAAYTNVSNPQTVYVRIENTETECIDTFDFTDDNSFQLFVEELPVVIDPTPLAICDDDYGTDPVEQTIFDLTVKESEISGQPVAPSDYEFVYYANEQDFQNDVPITDPSAYQNVENPQTIYITVVNGDSQNLCEDYTTLTITVQPLPSPSETDQDVLRLEQCDDDNDGVAAIPFNLTDSGNLIAGGENVELHYYKTERAAKEGDTNSAEYITTPDAYTNEPSYNTINAQGMEVQVIYVRVESGAASNACAVFTQFEIRVIAAPVLNLDPFGYTLCEDGSSGTAALFTEDIARNLYDASVATPDPSVIVPLLDQTENTDLDLDNYTVHYYSDQATPPTPFVSGTTVSTGDSVYVQVEYDETGCTSLIAEVIITVEPRPVIPGTDLMIEICSDEPGGSTVTIDLTQFDADVNPGAPADTEVAYYENIDAYNNGDAPIDTPTAYTTFENPQEIIGVVRNVNTLCESLDYSTILIEVNPTPMVDLSMYDGMVICTDSDPFTPVMGGDYEPITIETGLDETLYTFEWSLDGTMLPETGASILVSAPGTYSVTVTDVSSSVNTACTMTSSATIIESNPPEFAVNIMTESFSEAHTITISNVTGNGDYEFSVDQGPWTALGEGGSLTFTGLAAGEHIVYGRDKNGCGTTAVDASIIDYPKFVTPNGDGYNDTWNIIGISGQPDAKIYIFDRYGKLLKQLSPTGPGWDGTFNGEPVPSDDYWFRVEYTEPMDGTPKTFKANFTLKR